MRGKENIEKIKNLISRGITDAQELSKHTGLSLNRVYEIRKKLGYKGQRKKAQAKAQKQPKQATFKLQATQTPKAEPEPQIEPETTQTNLKEISIKNHIPTQNGHHPYVERRILNRTDFNILDTIYNKRTPLLLIGDTGTGKGLLLNAHIYTPTGIKLNKDLKINDEICTPNGKTAKIIGIYPQGKKDVYEITFSDGIKIECDDTHLWLVHSRIRNNPKYKTDIRLFETKYLFDKVNNKKEGNKIYSIDTTKPVYFKEQKIEINPYLLGYFIGNGYFGKTQGIRISIPQKETIDKIREIIKETNINCELKKIRIGDYIIKTKGKTNQLKTLLRKEGYEGTKSYQKHIPNKYLFNTKEIRKELLQGLMDADGTTNKKTGSASYCTTSKKLVEDIRLLIESLGGLCTINPKQPTYTNKGQKKKGRIAYNITTKLNNPKELFSLKRKKDLCKNRTKYKTKRIIREIRYIGKKETQCILIDDKNHLFLTNHFVVTHNTHCVRHFAYKKGLPYMRVNFNGATTPEDLIGQWTPKEEGGFKWIDGVLTKFVREGGVFVVDEINSGNADILFFLHPLLDDESRLVLVQKDGEVIKAHKDFWFVATMNPDYEGTKPLNLALQDRFVILEFDYDKKVEKKIVTNEKLLNFAEKIRALFRKGELSTPLSTRTLIYYEDAVKSFGKNIAQILLLNKFKPDERQAIKEVFELEVQEKKAQTENKTEGDTQ